MRKKGLTLSNKNIHKLIRNFIDKSARKMFEDMGKEPVYVTIAKMNNEKLRAVTPPHNTISEKVEELSKCSDVMPKTLSEHQKAIYNACLDVVYMMEKDFKERQFWSESLAQFVTKREILHSALESQLEEVRRELRQFIEINNKKTVYDSDVIYTAELASFVDDDFLAVKKN